MKVLPLISIIIPVYNVEKWLSRCVESIRMQTYENLEIILVDDGSTDSCGQLCDAMETIDKRIKVIHKANGGLSDARNAGLSNATGEYISFIDSDDWIESAFYECLFQTMQKGQYDIVGCEYRKCIEGKKQSSVSANFTVQEYGRVYAMHALIQNKIQQVVWNKLYKRSVVEGILFEKGKYHEDEFWSYQVFERVQKYATISYVGYNYFQRADSIMGETYSLKRLDAVQAKAERQKFLEKEMSELATYGRVNLIFTCLYHGQLAMQQLDGQERKNALKYLKAITYSNKLNNTDLMDIPFMHKFWLRLSQIAFVFTCKLRNVCGIGR